MREIIEISEAERRFKERQQRLYKEILEDDFPPLGSRVRPGPDWSSEDQDYGGPGTIVGHLKECRFINTNIRTISTGSS